MNLIRNKYYLVMLFCVTLAFFSGCRGNSSKKVAAEALEYIEKKGASKVESTVIHEGDDAIGRKPIRPRPRPIHDYDDDNDNYDYDDDDEYSH